MKMSREMRVVMMRAMNKVHKMALKRPKISIISIIVPFKLHALISVLLPRKIPLR